MHPKATARGILALIALIIGAPVLAIAGLPCSYQDLMPAYQKFLAAHTDASPETLAAAFVAQVAERFPDYYASKVFGNEDELRKRALRFFNSSQSGALFPGLPPLDTKRLSALADVIGPRFAVEQLRFMRAFPDFTCDTTVEFGVSLLKFDGHPTDFSGKHHLLFGVDVITLLHVPADMPAFFDHELFHLYHRQVIGPAAPHGEDPTWWTMWSEGLATYVSQRMNSGLDAQQVLWFPADIVTRMDQDLPHAAQLMLEDIEKRGAAASRWFLASESVDGLPRRAGYYLGYLLAKSEGDGKALAQLARMPPERVRARAIAFLTQTSAGPAVRLP